MQDEVVWQSSLTKSMVGELSFDEFMELTRALDKLVEGVCVSFGVFGEDVPFE